LFNFKIHNCELACIPQHFQGKEAKLNEKLNVYKGQLSVFFDFSRELAEGVETDMESKRQRMTKEKEETETEIDQQMMETLEQLEPSKPDDQDGDLNEKARQKQCSVDKSMESMNANSSADIRQRSPGTASSSKREFRREKSVTPEAQHHRRQSKWDKP
jgi:hypothetical protein